MPNENIVLKLHDYLVGECPFGGCKHNTGKGICLSNDEGYLNYISKIVNHALDKNTGRIENQNIICSQLEVKDGQCEFCGSRLIEIHEKHPFGDSTATEVLYECKNC